MRVGVGPDLREVLNVQDIEIGDGKVLMVRHTGLEDWHEVPLQDGIMEVVGMLQVEMCNIGPSDPVKVVKTLRVISGTTGFGYMDTDGPYWFAYGLWPHVFIREQDRKEADPGKEEVQEVDKQAVLG